MSRDAWMQLIFWAVVMVIAFGIYGAFARSIDWAECRKEHGASYCRSVEAQCEQGANNKWCPA